jgi:hypothetical protein
MPFVAALGDKEGEMVPDGAGKYFIAVPVPPTDTGLFPFTPNNCCAYSAMAFFLDCNLTLAEFLEIQSRLI